MVEISEDNFLSIAGEGNDGSGKNTAVLTMLEHVVEEEDRDVILTNFPQYFLPSGFLVRSMLRGDGDEYFEMMEAIPDQELKVRMAMFQLDRIIAWGVLESYRRDHSDVLHLSDRLGMSQVNTWAFVVSKFNLAPEEADSLFELAMNQDIELYKHFKPLTVVFAAGQQNCGVNRVELDQYERKDAVGKAEKGYMDATEVFNETGRSARVVNTKDESGRWRDRDMIAKEALESVGVNFTSHPQGDFDLYEAVKNGKLTIVGPYEFLRTYYPDYDIDSDDELKRMIEEWLSVSLIPEISVPGNGLTKKEILDQIETKLAFKIDTIMEEQKSPYLRKIFGDSFGLVREAIIRLGSECKEMSLERFLIFLCDKKGLSRSYAKLIYQFVS